MRTSRGVEVADIFRRHCPKWQTLRKEDWIQKRSEDLLPVQYFHIVFTIPAEPKPLALMNQRVLYDLLFCSVSETLLELSANPAHLGARIGFIAILHTWGQNLMDHPHLHYRALPRVAGKR